MKRLGVTSLVVGLLFVVTTIPVSAKIQEVEQFQEAYTYAQQNNAQSQEAHTFDSTTFGGAVWTITNVLGGVPRKTGMVDASGKPEVAYSQGLVGDMGRAVAMLYEQQPANTRTYVADLLNTAGIAQPAYAQGLGFASLTPILETWKTFRDIAYLFFVVLFLAIGFMIMLRQKMGGQTAVTAQQAIPHIIVSLLFVTFSYAIAGLLIDLMYVLMFLMLGLFGKTGNLNQFVGMNFLELGYKMVTAGFTTAFEAVDTFTGQAQGLFAQAGAEVVDFLGGITMGVVVAIAIALNVFRLFFELLKTYITIVLNIVFSPVLLMFGAIPGKNMFMGWVKNMVGNLMAFPAVLLVLIVFDELTGGLTGSAPVIEQGGFLPPYLFGRSGGTVTGGLSFALGLGMLLVMPEIVKQVKKTMGVKEGIFEQLAGDMGQSLKKGWTGSEFIPGIAGTHTANLPFIGKYIGSGSNVVKTGAVGISGAAAGLGGAYGGAFQAVGSRILRRGLPGPGSVTTGTRAARGVGTQVAKWVKHPAYKEEGKK